MTIFKIFGICLVLAVIAFIGYRLIPAKETVLTDGLVADRHIRLASDVTIEQKLPQSDIELKEIQIMFGTYKRTNDGILTVSLLENDNLIQQWFLRAEKLADNAYQSFVLNKKKKLNPESNYIVKVSYHYSGDNFIALWTNKDAKYGSFKNGEQALDGSVCYKLVYLKEKQ